MLVFFKFFFVKINWLIDWLIDLTIAYALPGEMLKQKKYIFFSQMLYYYIARLW